MHYHNHDDGHGHSTLNSETGEAWRRTLWIALIVNAIMFAVEMIAGVAAESSSLQANALDFFGDAMNYAVSLGAMGMAVAWHTRAAFFKGFTLLALGFWVLGTTGWYAYLGVVPEVPTMGVIGAIALIANFVVAVMLYRFRNGDANMKSVWLCTRNDVAGNLAVLLAAVGVFGTTSGYPDFIVAIVMAYLGISAGWQTLRQALREHKDHLAIK
jgi:Co/Zn/Cd efflux system component